MTFIVLLYILMAFIVYLNCFYCYTIIILYFHPICFLILKTEYQNNTGVLANEGNSLEQNIRHFREGLYHLTL